MEGRTEEFPMKKFEGRVVAGRAEVYSEGETTLAEGKYELVKGAPSPKGVEAGM